MSFHPLLFYWARWQLQVLSSKSGSKSALVATLKCQLLWWELPWPKKQQILPLVSERPIYLFFFKGLWRQIQWLTERHFENKPYTVVKLPDREFGIRKKTKRSALFAGGIGVLDKQCKWFETLMHILMLSTTAALPLTVGTLDLSLFPLQTLYLCYCHSITDSIPLLWATTSSCL